MQLDLSADFGALAADLRRRGADLPWLVAKGVVDATGILYEGSRGKLSELIYNRLIPSVKRFRRQRSESGNWRAAGESGKRSKSFFGFAHSSRQSTRAAWKRTSTLLRNERMEFRGTGVETEGLVDNKTPYAAARHNLDRPSPYGYDNRAPWRTEAVATYGQAARAKFREALAAVGGS